MNKIYKYFTHKKEKKINEVGMNMSLLQGLDILNKKNQNLLEIASHFKYNDNLKKNLIEANTNMDDVGSKFGINLAGFSTSDKAIVEENLIKFNQLQTKYNTNLTKYQEKYKELLEEYMKYELGEGDGVDNGAVHKCKVKCNEENSNESNKIACEVGCGLKSPYLIDCKNTFKSTEDNSCEKVVESNKCNPTKKRPIDTYYSELSQNKDENGVSIVDGCCKCGGGKFGPPSVVVDNTKYTSCYDFETTGEINKCLNATIENEEDIKSLPAKYKEVLKLNEDMIDDSDNMLAIVNALKDFNIDLTISKQNLQENYNQDSMKYNLLLEEISKFTEKRKNTLSARLQDGKLKKTAFDFRNNIWLILAIGFGTVALFKIKDL